MYTYLSTCARHDDCRTVKSHLSAFYCTATIADSALRCIAHLQWAFAELQPAAAAQQQPLQQQYSISLARWVTLDRCQMDDDEVRQVTTSTGWPSISLHPDKPRPHGKWKATHHTHITPLTSSFNVAQCLRVKYYVGRNESSYTNHIPPCNLTNMNEKAIPLHMLW